MRGPVGDPESWNELFSADPEYAEGYRGKSPLRAAVPGRKGDAPVLGREMERLMEGLRRLARDLADVRDASRKRTGDLEGDLSGKLNTLEQSLAVRLGEIEARLAEAPAEGGSVDGAALGALSRRLAELERSLAGSGQQLEGLWRAMGEQTETAERQAVARAAEALAAIEEQTADVRQAIDDRMVQAEALLQQRLTTLDATLDQRLAATTVDLAARATAAETAATRAADALEGFQASLDQLQREAGPEAVQSRIDEGAKALRQEVTGFLNELRGTWQERIGAIAERLEARELEERQRGDALVQSLEERAGTLQQYSESVAARVEAVLSELAEVRQEADERLTRVTESVTERAEAAKAAFDARTEELRSAVQNALEHGVEAKLETLRQQTAAGLEAQRAEIAAALEARRADADALRGEIAAALEARRGDEEALREELVANLEAVRAEGTTVRDEILARLEARRGDEEALEARLARAVSEAEVRVAERVAQIEDLARAAREGATIDAERTADLAAKIDERVTRGEGALEHAIRDVRMQMEERTATMETAASERAQATDARLLELAEQMRISLEGAVSNVRRELTVRVDENTESLEGRLDALTARSREIAELLDDRSEGLRAALELQGEAVQSSLAGRLDALEAILGERVRELQAGLAERARSETDVAQRMGLVADGLSDWLRDTDDRLEARSAAAEEASARHEAAERALADSLAELARTAETRDRDGRNETISWLEALRAEIQEQQLFEAGARGELVAGLSRQEQIQQAGRDEVMNALTSQREEVLGALGSQRDEVLGAVEARLASLRDRLADAVGQTLSTGASLTETVQRTRAEALDAAETAARRAESAVESVRDEALGRAEAIAAENAAALEGIRRDLGARLESETDDLASRVDAITAELRAGLEDPGAWRERAAELEGALGERVAAVGRAMAERLGMIEATLPGLVSEVRANLDHADERASSSARALVDNATRGLKERVEEVERTSLDVATTLQRVEREVGDRLDTRQIRIEQEVQEQLSDFRIALAEAIRRIQEESTTDRVGDLEVRERLAAAERGLSEQFQILGDRLAKQARASETNVRRRLEMLAGAVAEMENQRRSTSLEVDALTDAHAALVKSLEVMGERTSKAANAAARAARKKGLPDLEPDDPVLPRLLAIEKEIHSRLTTLERAVDQEIGESRDDVTRRLALLEERWSDLLEERLAGLIEKERKSPAPTKRRRREEE